MQTTFVFFHAHSTHTSAFAERERERVRQRERDTHTHTQRQRDRERDRELTVFEGKCHCCLGLLGSVARGLVTVFEGKNLVTVTLLLQKLELHVDA